MLLLTRDVQLTSMHFYAWKKGLKTGMSPLAIYHICSLMLSSFSLSQAATTSALALPSMPSNSPLTRL
jgi:hypothetical protein